MNTRNTLIIAIGGFILLIVVAVLLFFAVNPPAKTVSTNVKKTFLSTFPFSNGLPFKSSTKPNVPASAGSASTITVRSLDGTISVSDFTKIPGVASTTDGSFLTWLPASEEYEVFYLPLNQSFTIVLLNEPIAEIRRKATADLQAKLGVSNKELCNLIAEVTVPYFVNDFYSTKNLGFSGCPGGVKFEGDTNF